MNGVRIVRKTADRLQDSPRFRSVYSSAYPALRKLGVIDALKKLEGGAGGDPWAHNKSAGKFEALFQKYSIDPHSLVRPKRRYVFGFLLLPDEDSLENIEKSSAALGTGYEIFDIRDPTLYQALRESPCDGLFIMPAYDNNTVRDLFHEAAQILSSESRIRIYPSLRELNIYEGKRRLAAFLAVNGIPHPATSVFHDYEAARDFIGRASFPLIFKTHVGSSANGVEILRTPRQALRLARRLFDKTYLRRNEPEPRSREWGYLLLQEYIEDVREFRIIKLGDSWFGYQKWKKDGQRYFSGSGVEKHIDPPRGLLDFCHGLAEKHQFTSMCFDIFQDRQGAYLVNELQTWFGSHNPSQMYVDGVPGRYRRTRGEWVFEPGLFNVHGSMLLRLVHFINIIEQEQNSSVA